MRRFASSEAYVRARLINAAVFVILGSAIAVRAFATVGANPKAIPAYVLAFAMIGLGVSRVVVYLRARGSRP